MAVNRVTQNHFTFLSQLLDISVVWLSHSHQGRSKRNHVKTLFCVCFSAYFLKREFQKGKVYSSKLWTPSADVNMLVMLPVSL